MNDELLESRKIERTGNGTYRIQSTTEKDQWYSVDVLANEGLGWCSCKNFQFSKLPKWERLRIPTDGFRCKHLRRVRSHVLDLILAAHIRQEKPTNQPNQNGKQVRKDRP